MSFKKFNIKKFDRNANFGLWRLKMKENLVQNELEKAMLEKSNKPLSKFMEELEELDLKTLTLIKVEDIGSI